MMNHRLLRPIALVIGLVLPSVLTPSPPSFAGTVLSGGGVTPLPSPTPLSGGAP